MDEARFAALEAKVREHEDLRQIHDAFFHFHYGCTGGFNGKQAGRMEALDVLTEDATIEVEGLHEPGKGPRGREEVAQYWEYYFGDAGPLPYVFQTSVSEKVDLTGDTAIGYSTMLIIANFRDKTPTLAMSQRVNDYVRTPEGWKIRKTTIVGGYHTEINPVGGNLNKLPAQESRTPWKYTGK